MSRLAATRVSVSFGGLVVLDEVSVSIGAGDRIGIIAPNGVGKSTLLRVLPGELEPDSGRVLRAPATTTVLRLAQEPDIRPGESLAAHLARSTEVAAAEADLHAATGALARGGPGADDTYDGALQRWLTLGGADLPERMAEVTAQLGLAEDLLGRNVAELSGGQQARFGLATVLLAQPDILLLDEPTNDLDDAGLALLEGSCAGLLPGSRWSAMTGRCSRRPRARFSSSTSSRGMARCSPAAGMPTSPSGSSPDGAPSTPIPATRASVTG
jgi:ATPase subunit of ABC transporter with duplicated ATPase domains